MKKLVLNAIVLVVFGFTFGLSSCNLFGSKEQNITLKTNDTITKENKNIIVDSLNKDSIIVKEQHVNKK